MCSHNDPSMDPLNSFPILLPTPLLPNCQPSLITIAAIMSAFVFPPSYVPIVDPTAYPCATLLRSFDPNFVASLVSSTAAPDAPLFPVIFDTGGSFAITPDVQDFIGPSIFKNWGKIQTATGMKMKMIALGVVSWQMVSHDGATVNIKVPDFLVPVANIRLFSPQDYANIMTSFGKQNLEEMATPSG